MFQVLTHDAGGKYSVVGVVHLDGTASGSAHGIRSVALASSPVPFRDATVESQRCRRPPRVGEHGVFRKA